MDPEKQGKYPGPGPEAQEKDLLKSEYCQESVAGECKMERCTESDDCKRRMKDF